MKQWKALNTIVKTKKDLMWKDTTLASDYIDALEMVLNQSPIPVTGWIWLIPNTVAATEKGMQTWIDRYIITPLVSWNEARKRFTLHYQRADYMEECRREYAALAQVPKESAQRYGDRFYTLSITKMNLTDQDPMNIEYFIEHALLNIR